MIAWYPFNGNISNNGDENFDLESSTPNLNYSLGKIGNSITFNGNYLKAKKSPFKNTTTYSICGWVYLDNIEDTQTIICSRNGIGFGLSIFVIGSKLRFDASVDGNPSQWTTNYIFEAKKWTHFVVENDNGKLCYYINGEKQQQTKTITPTTEYIGNYMSIGASSGNETWIGNGNFLKGMINDLRIYDNILSQSEIQDIYHTLITKYTFDTPTENPMISTAGTENISYLLNGEVNQCSTIGQIAYNKNYFVDNNYFTVSFDLTIKDVISNDSNSGYISLQEHTAINGAEKWNTIMNTDYEINKKSNRFGNFLGDKEVLLSTNGTYHFVRTYKLKNTSIYSSVVYVQVRCDYLNGGTMFVSNFKVNLGKKEILSDGTEGILYDESGHGYNCQLIGNSSTLYPLLYSTESKIGEGCYQSVTKVENEDSFYRAFEGLTQFYVVPEISISFWLYVPETDNNTEDNSILGCSADYSNYGIWIRRNGTALHVTIYNVALENPIILTRGKWQYIVVTAQKQGGIKVYLDGVLYSSKNNISGVNWENAFLIIGDIRKNRVLSFDGKIDDLRIYATILDDNFIKKLFREREKIDKMNNFYCNQITENVGFKIPEEYQLVEYLENTGNNYIDTGIFLNDTKSIEIGLEFNIDDIQNPDGAFFFGEKTDSTGHYSGIGWGNSDFAYRYGDTPYRLNITPKSNLNYKIKFKKNEEKINGILKQNLSAQNIETELTNSIFLFGVNYNGNISNNFQGKVYYFKVFEENKLINYFVPCYKIENKEIGMYDILSNSFISSLGDSNFILGEEKNTINTDLDIKFLGNGMIVLDNIQEGKEIKILKNNNSLETNCFYEY